MADTTEDTTVVDEDDNLLNMSDEEFLKDEPVILAKAEEDALAASAETDTGGTDESDDTAVDKVEETATTTSADTDTSTDAERDESAGTTDLDETGTGDATGTDTDTKSDVATDTELKDDKTDTDAGSEADIFVKQILAPFKANGTMMQVRTADEAVTLMKMGVNYNSKMAVIKPQLKTVKMLTKAGLTNEADIGFLIDVHNKDPEAIKKLLKDNDIDPSQIDTTNDVNYQPKDHSVSDTEIDIDTTLNGIADSPHYSRTLDVIGKQWDKSSREVISNHPNIINIINEDIGSGVFDAINTEVVRAKNLGQLGGTSDLQAYRLMGEYMEKEFLLPGQTKPETANAAKQAAKVTVKKDESKRDKRRAVAGRTTTTTSTEGKAPGNALAISDEEFLKLPPENFKVK